MLSDKDTLSVKSYKTVYNQLFRCTKLALTGFLIGRFILKSSQPDCKRDRVDEILLRARTVHFINAPYWENYVPSAKEYLNKYGANINESEKKMFQEVIDRHSH